MKRTLFVAAVVAMSAIAFLGANASQSRAQVDSTAVDSTATPPPATAPAVTTSQPPAAAPAEETAAVPKKKRPMFYGGTVGMTFGDYTSISISPMVGLKLTPRVSVGVMGTYEYIKDTRYKEDVTASNYGGSVFARFFPVPRFYGHAEFEYMSYKYSTSDLETDRTWVPFLLLGGGIVQPISPRAALTVEVLFDVLNDDHSPYESGHPWVSVGVGVGI